MLSADITTDNIDVALVDRPLAEGVSATSKRVEMVIHDDAAGSTVRVYIPQATARDLVAMLEGVLEQED